MPQPTAANIDIVAGLVQLVLLPLLWYELKQIYEALIDLNNALDKINRISEKYVIISERNLGANTALLRLYKDRINSLKGNSGNRVDDDESSHSGFR